MMFNICIGFEWESIYVLSPKAKKLGSGREA